MPSFGNYLPMGYQQPYYPQPQVPQTKVVEVVPVDTPEAAETSPVQAGSTVVFFAKDDSFIAVKAVGVSGQTSFTVYDRRPPAPRFDPAAYVRRDELDALVAQAMASHRGAQNESV